MSGKILLHFLITKMILSSVLQDYLVISISGMNAPMSVILFHGDIHQGTRSEITTFVWTCRAYSRPLFGTTNAPNLVP